MRPEKQPGSFRQALRIQIPSQTWLVTLISQVGTRAGQGFSLLSGRRKFAVSEMELRIPCLDLDFILKVCFREVQSGAIGKLMILET